MEDCNLDLMMNDFIKKHRWDTTKEELVAAITNNETLITNDAFFIFGMQFNKFYIFYAYSKPGTNTRYYVDFLESYAKYKGCTKMAFATKRAKAFAKVYPDFEQAGVIFEKEL